MNDARQSLMVGLAQEAQQYGTHKNCKLDCCTKTVMVVRERPNRLMELFGYYPKSLRVWKRETFVASAINYRAFNGDVYDIYVKGWKAGPVYSRRRAKKIESLARFVSPSMEEL